MKFYVGVRDQVAVLFKVMGNADDLSMPFDYQAVEVWHVEAYMKVILCLEGFQLVV